jgi:hypothetical protein
VRGFALSFDESQEALLELFLSPAVAGTEGLSATVGLDGVARVSPGGRFGLPVAVKGAWETSSRFVIDLDEIANIGRWRFSIAFQDEIAAFTMQDATGLGGLTLEARSADLPPGEVDEDGR